MRAAMVWLLATLLIFVCPKLSDAQKQDDEGDDVPDFSLTQKFVRQLADQNTITFPLAVTLTDRTKRVHPLSADCEMHLVANSQDTLGSPSGLVVEPPNLCKIPPPGSSKISAWPGYLDDNVMERTCIV